MERFAALGRRLKALLVAALAGSAAAPPVAAQVDPADAAAWEAARALGTADACQAYLVRFPAGRYAEEAFRCVVEAALPPLAPVAPPAGPRRPAPGPDDGGERVFPPILPGAGPVVPPVRPY